VLCGIGKFPDLTGHHPQRSRRSVWIPKEILKRLEESHRVNDFLLNVARWSRASRPHALKWIWQMHPLRPLDHDPYLVRRHFHRHEIPDKG
jgi:hypothetical protein